MGWAAHKAGGNTFPDAVEHAAKAADGVSRPRVSAPTTTRRAQGGLNPSGELRKRLDLYANIRPGIRPALRQFDLVIVRENTEGFYADRNMFQGAVKVVPDAVRSGAGGAQDHARRSMRIAEAAFKLAMTRRKQVTAVHKANVLRVGRALSRMHQRRRQDIRRYASSTSHGGAADPRDAGMFDVIVTTNMFGDILSDEASEISGSLGLAASLNHGAERGVAHGSAPDIARKISATRPRFGSDVAGLGERRKDDKLGKAGRSDRGRAELDNRQARRPHARYGRQAGGFS